MTIERFRFAVDRGMGRAALCLLENDPDPFIPELIAACVADRPRYYQEADRGPYFVRLAEIAGVEEPLLDAVLAGLPDSDGEHLDTLLRIFTERGHYRAKTALLARSLQDPQTAGELARMGAPGLKWLIAARPELFRPEDSDHAGYWINVAEEKSGRDAVAAILTDDARACRWPDEPVQGKPTEASAPTYGEVVRLVEEGKNLPRIRSVALDLGRNGSPEDRRRLAELMLRQEDPNLLWALRTAFRWSPWPLDEEPIFARIDGEGRAARAWRQVLERVKSPAVRQFALERLRQTTPDSDAIGFLTPNFEPGDEDLLLDALRRVDPCDEDTVHGMGMDLSHLVKEVGVPRFASHLVWMVEHGPCSFCRAGFLEKLAGAGLLSDAYRREAAYDAEEETRALATPPSAAEPPR